MSKEHLSVTIEEGIGIVTLKRPPHNAFNSGLFRKMYNQFKELEKDDTVKVIVFTGGIRNCFSSGADLDELFGEGTTSDLYQGNYRGVLGAQRVFKEIEACPKPVIAAINGVCIGAGLELALSCDLRVASELAYFSLPEAVKQIIPGLGGTVRLTRLVGPGRAKEMVMLGRMVRAETALKWGLVNWITPPDKVLSVALEKARELTGIPQRVIAAIKEVVWVTQDETLERGLEREVNLFIDLMKQKLLPHHLKKG